VAIGKDVGHVPVWDIRKKNIVQNFVAPDNGRVTDVAFAPGEATLVIVGPGHLKVWKWPRAGDKK
jgi:hypothetical protein